MSQPLADGIPNSSMSEPARKRPRVEDADENKDHNLPSSAPRKDDDVWLSDGSIVVVAADNVAFRVHKSSLARRSEIFRDLFSLPNADAATAETMEPEGCPIVRVSDVSEDIRHLLSVLCCGKNYYYDGDTLITVPFEILNSLIRMAHKYAVQDVLDHALSRLKKYYTNDLAAWRDTATRARYVTMQEYHALTVVELARLTNTPSLLPTAFLQCTTFLTTCKAKAGAPVSLAIASLPVPDQRMLIGAREYLMHMCAERSLYLLAVVPGIGCTTPVACKTTREAPMMAARNGKGFPGPSLHCRDVLKPMATTFWNDTQWRTFCGGCRASLARVEETMSKWTWSTLPALFGVKELDKDSWPSISADGQA